MIPPGAAGHGALLPGTAGFFPAGGSVGALRVPRVVLARPLAPNGRGNLQGGSISPSVYGSDLQDGMYGSQQGSAYGSRSSTGSSYVASSSMAAMEYTPRIEKQNSAIVLVKGFGQKTRKWYEELLSRKSGVPLHIFQEWSSETFFARTGYEDPRSFRPDSVYGSLSDHGLHFLKYMRSSEENGIHHLAVFWPAVKTVTFTEWAFSEDMCYLGRLQQDYLDLFCGRFLRQSLQDLLGGLHGGKQLCDINNKFVAFFVELSFRCTIEPRRVMSRKMGYHLNGAYERYLKENGQHVQYEKPYFSIHTTVGEAEKVCQDCHLYRQIVTVKD